MTDAFDKHFGRLLLVAAASALGGGAIRFGTDRLADQVEKLNAKMASLEGLPTRVANLEALVLTPVAPRMPAEEK